VIAYSALSWAVAGTRRDACRILIPAINHLASSGAMCMLEHYCQSFGRECVISRRSILAIGDRQDNTSADRACLFDTNVLLYGKGSARVCDIGSTRARGAGAGRRNEQRFGMQPVYIARRYLVAKKTAVRLLSQCACERSDGTTSHPRIPGAQSKAPSNQTAPI